MVCKGYDADLYLGSISADGGNGLSLNGSKDNVPEVALWTVKSANGGYTVKDSSGKYLTIGSNTAGLTTAETVIRIDRNGNNWTINQNGAYLNDFGGKAVCAAGWQNAAAQNDDGSQWLICTVQDVPVAGTSEITFTGVGVGKTSVLIGNTIYNITVTTAAECTHANTETRDAVPATCTAEGYSGDTWCLDCETKIADGTKTPTADHTEQIIPGKDATCSETGLTDGKKCSVCGKVLVEQEEIPTLDHDYVNGDCSDCDAQLKSSFEDVFAGEFYFDAVEWAVEQKITTGTDATHFTPDGACMRGHVVTFLWRAMGSPEPKTSDNPFEDVPENEYYYKAVLWAYENGITTGTDATHFAPEGECNRAQVVTFLWRAMNKPASDTKITFSDVKAGQFYTEAVAWAVENNITNGMSNGNFGVETTCNRAHVVTFLYRTLDK